MKRLQELKKRFNENKNFHNYKNFDDLLPLLNSKEILEIIDFMEKLNGEPNIVLINNKLAIVDCIKEQPKSRCSLCYDEKALLQRKKYPAKGSVEGLIKDFNVRLINEEEYIYLQTLFDFDLKTSSWIYTPEDFRSLGGALFGSKRYNRTFIFQNGADSYYNVRGFRLIKYLE